MKQCALLIATHPPLTPSLRQHPHTSQCSFLALTSLPFCLSFFPLSASFFPEFGTSSGGRWEGENDVRSCSPVHHHPFYRPPKSTAGHPLPILRQLPTSDHASSHTQRCVMVLPRWRMTIMSPRWRNAKNAAKMAGPLCRRDSFK